MFVEQTKVTEVTKNVCGTNKSDRSNKKCLWNKKLGRSNKKCLWNKKRDRSSKKNFPVKIELRGTKSLLCLFLLHFTALCGLLQINMVLYGLLLPYYCVLYRSNWTCIVLSRGHRSKFIWSCFLRI